MIGALPPSRETHRCCTAGGSAGDRTEAPGTGCGTGNRGDDDVQMVDAEPNDEVMIGDPFGVEGGPIDRAGTNSSAQ